MAMFAPKPGCPICGIVASALPTPSNSWRAPALGNSTNDSTDPEVLWKDQDFTAYREKWKPVSSKGHIIIAFNLHVPSLYDLSSTDLPLLVNIRNLATRLLTALDASSRSPTPTPNTQSFPSSPISLERNSHFRIGFITPPFKDNKIPVTDHLHAHAYIEPSDLMGWWRGLAYGSLAWYAIDDLIAEIRETVSNNRVKSGYENRQNAPIDKVPLAGARSGTAHGVETTEPGLPRPESNLEDGETPSRTPTSAQAMLTSYHS
ncbi:hypothetical protein GGU10DRAFT_359847 [Lentinula aff. detonsa]|uniref:HIT domain-containing protein n=1 Tax=Lentinula aff. detonsa TaxID=2804958 RepID=A0AA38KQY7_9AGAR|nr:hypothetical protein GGU10DRAFT_359847 [Lentinula aff. detonsa]